MRWSAAEALSWVITGKALDLRNWIADMGPKIESAQRKLSKAIAEGRVKAFGRKTSDLHAVPEQVPATQFDLSDVTVVVGVHGDMTTLPPHKQYRGPRWQDIQFDPNEIKRELPQRIVPSAQQWMYHEAKKLKDIGQVGKREDMVNRCMTNTGCNQRQAQAAHKALPQEFRRPRGNRSRRAD